MNKSIWEVVLQCRDNGEYIKSRIVRYQFAEAACYAYLKKNTLKQREAKILSVNKVGEKK